ncbi:endospore germination permease [Ammoniphilus sp. 3BR4]|uniref:GerAB/ArcD/ProY family transporter n=1 Tax=Ammoniphilus sp. 3BR4 TaxID=3158265 RepID=UPI003465F073
MIEKGRISALQMALLIYANPVSTAMLTLPGLSFKYAEHDMWLAPIWASLPGFLVVYIIWQLNRLYPNQTLIQYTPHILGKIAGKAVGFVYLFFFLYNCGASLRMYGEFLIGVFLNRTPLVLVMGILTLATTFAVRAGLEVLARLSDMFVPIIFLLWLIIVLLLIPELEVKNMLPIMENGITPSLKAAIIVAPFFELYFYIFTLLPYLSDRKQGLKWGMISVVAVMVTLVMTNLAALLLFGGITGSFIFPIMTVARYISYADFFENLEAVVMAIWIGGTFIKLGLFQYTVVLNTAQWLNLSDYKPLTLPFGLLMTLFGIWVFPNLSEQAYASNLIYPILHPIMLVIIPTALLLFALLRKRYQKLKTE